MITTKGGKLSMTNTDFTGIHLQLTNVDKNLNTEDIFPVNTGDDVIIDSHNNPLSVYLPTVDDAVSSPTESSPMYAVAYRNGEVNDTVMTALTS
jgi:hypothetical protein